MNYEYHPILTSEILLDICEMSTSEIIIERLSPDERKELQKRLIGYLVFLAIAIGMSVLFFSFIPNDTFTMVAMGIFWLFFFSVIGYLIRGPLVDLNKNQKLIVRGIIDNKISHVRKKTSSISRSITIDGKQYYCEYHHWKDLKSGYRVELHYAKASNYTLKLLTLGATSVAPSKTDFYNDNSANIGRDYDAELNPEDIKIAKKVFRKWARFRIIAIIVLLWPMLGLALSGLYAVILFMFPFPLVILILSIALIRKRLKLRADIANGAKSIKHVQVIDKNLTVRRARRYCQIKTTQGNLTVDESVFDQIRPNQNIKIISLPITGILLGILDENDRFIIAE